MVGDDYAPWKTLEDHLQGIRLLCERFVLAFHRCCHNHLLTMRSDFFLLAKECQMEWVGLSAIEHSGARRKLARTNPLSAERARTLEVAGRTSSGEKEPAVIHLMLQTGGELIDVGGRNVSTRTILKKWRPVAAYGVTANLQK